MDRGVEAIKLRGPTDEQTTISVPVLNTPLTDLPAMAHRAEDAGFDRVWSYELWRNPDIGLSGPALSTNRIML